MKLVMLLSMPGGSEWLLIFLIAILLFGGKKLPELARGIGRAVAEFNTAKDSMKSEIEKGIKEADEKKNQPTSADATGTK
jgi:sec-independent protein translocase protein TatA